MRVPTSPGITLNEKNNVNHASSCQGERLKREIGVWGIFINVINNTIGSGIFLLPAIVAGVLGNASIVAYIACGLLFLLVMLCYAEISSQVTCSGGSYAYIEKAFGSYAGFISNTLFWFGVGVFVTAALVNGFADILSVAFPIFKIPLYRALLFIALIGFSAYINILGVKQGMKVIKIVTFIKMLPLFLLVVLGFWGSKLLNLRMDHLPTFQNLGEVSLVLFFAFAGGETALNIGGEMKNPSRTAPLGIIYGMLATILIFCLIQLAAQGVLGAGLSNFKEAPLAAVADNLIGPVGHTIIIVASLIAIFGILSSLPLAFPRVMLAGAEDNLLPRYLSKIHSRFATPANAIITFSVIAFLVAVSGGFRQLAIIVSASLLLLYAGVVLATIKFRLKKNTDKKDTFKIPGGLAIPIAALMALCFFIVQLQLKEIVGIVIFIGILSIIYLIKITRKRQLDKILLAEV